MPKKVKARKNTKTQVTQRLTQTKRELLLKEPGQEYAKITRMLGERRVECELFSNGKASNGETKIGRIRTGMKRKGAFISNGDIVLVSLRDFQENKVDIIHLYTKGEVESLKKKKHIPRESNECNLFAYSDGDDDSEEETEDEAGGENEDEDLFVFDDI